MSHGIPTSGPRLQKWLKNPGLRSKLPDSSLSVGQLAARRANAAKTAQAQGVSSLTNPLATLSGADLANAAEAQVGLQYDPQSNALSRQRSDILASSRSLSDYAGGQYQLASARARGILANAPNDGHLALEAQQGISDAAARAITSARDEANARIGTSGPYSDVATSQFNAADAGATARSADNTTAQLANTGKAADAQAELAREMLGAYQQQGAEFQGRLANDTSRRLNENDQAVRDLNTTRQGAFVDALTKLRQEQFDNYATGQTLGIKQDQIAADLAMANARDKTTRRGQDIANSNADATRQVAIDRLAAYRQNIDWAHQDRLASIAARAKNGGKGLTPAQERALHQENTRIRGALQTASSLYGSIIGQPKDANDPKSTRVTPKEAIAGIATKYFKGDLGLAQVAYYLYKYNGNLGAEGARILAAHGIGLPADWKRTPGYTPAQGG